MSADRQLFGTDGIRGVANRHPLTCETALRLGRAVGRRCTSSGAEPIVVIGRDTRRSGPMLEAALTAGLASAGARVLQAGVVPTPAVALLTRALAARAGIVISASHNPFADNGLKCFGADGFKLPDDAERELERDMHADVVDVLPTGAGVGDAVSLTDAESRYIDALHDRIGREQRLRGMRVVVDAANGAAYRVAPALLQALGAEVIADGVQPDGMNINRDCGALHPQRLQARVLATQATAGLALDGDADRVVMVDERGAVLDGDDLLAIMAMEMVARDRLRGGAVVATVMSNLGLELALKARGIRLVRVAVGDRYVVDAMRRGGFNLGGEQSGHIILLDHSTTGDGLLAGAQLLRLAAERQRPLSALRAVLTRLPQVLRSLRVPDRRPIDTLPGIAALMARIEAALGERGRLLVRYSGTEPLIRVMLEGEDLPRIEQLADELVAALQSAFGVPA